MTHISYDKELVEEYVKKIQYVKPEGSENQDDKTKPSIAPTIGPYYDAMLGCARWTIPVHEHGHVTLVDMMPRLVPIGQTPDFAVVQAARVSYGAGTKKSTEDTGLIRYLIRHRHTTPSEMVEFKFHCKMPIFVARQWIRHRTASVNEYSARYSIVKDEFYVPEHIHGQSSSNNQGSNTALTFDEHLEKIESLVRDSYNAYDAMVKDGVAREQARMVLPTNVYTEWYWKIDLHNLMHFLSLRMDKHAQKEIQDFSLAMFAIVREIIPVSMQAFVDYRLDGVFLTRLEVEALQNQSLVLNTKNKRETDEWVDKAKNRLGLGWAQDKKDEGTEEPLSNGH
ncbi:thymidylate synthase [Acrasis kona]|uniref:Thymidylate synthase n=1 Tax=Acrasis kona TaxID=1008807 RepID=A0AAW2YZS0_9EUKA